MYAHTTLPRGFLSQIPEGQLLGQNQLPDMDQVGLESGALTQPLGVSSFPSPTA